MKVVLHYIRLFFCNYFCQNLKLAKLSCQLRMKNCLSGQNEKIFREKQIVNVNGDQ